MLYVKEKGKKTGKQNTQLELSVSQLPINKVVSKLIDAIEVCRVHQAEYEWKNMIR